METQRTITTAKAARRLAADWIDDPQAARTPIGELIDGLDDVAALAIPYARLPRRAHNAYAAQFTNWSDIADQTIESLLSRPKVGESTVHALLEAAKHAVTANHSGATVDRVGPAAAVRCLLDRFDARYLAMLSARLWSPHPPSQRVIAQQLGVATVWVQRNQPRAEALLAELLADPTHREIGEHAHELRRRLGPYTPADTVAAELQRLDIDPTSTCCCTSQAPMCSMAIGSRTSPLPGSNKSQQ